MDLPRNMPPSEKLPSPLERATNGADILAGVPEALAGRISAGRAFKLIHIPASYQFDLFRCDSDFQAVQLQRANKISVSVWRRRRNAVPKRDSSSPRQVLRRDPRQQREEPIPSVSVRPVVEGEPLTLDELAVRRSENLLKRCRTYRYYPS